MIAVALAAAMGSPPRLPATPPDLLREEPFTLGAPAEVTADLRLRCDRCSWGARGREAAALRLEVDGSYSQHLVLTRGRGDYAVALGGLPAGAHSLRVFLDRAASAPGAREVAVEAVAVEQALPGTPKHEALAHAPVLHLRADSLPRFTDLPLVLWHERDSLPDGGRRLRYSVVFSNEDGGTPPDRLLATWGRLTDIEFVYGVELGPDGRARRAVYQGEDHAILSYPGKGERPRLWVTTRNNMLAPSGTTSVRVAPVSVPFDLEGSSREAVMDAHPWTYRVSSEEVRREGRVQASAVMGRKRISDPRRYLYLEACADMEDAALAFAAGRRRGHGPVEWRWSDGGPLGWRVERNRDHFPNGCFRAAVALPGGVGPRDLAGLRFRAFPRPRERDDPAPAARPPRPAVLKRVNLTFVLRDDDTPGSSLFSWTGELPLPLGGEPAELEIGAAEPLP